MSLSDVTEFVQPADRALSAAVSNMVRRLRSCPAAVASTTLGHGPAAAGMSAAMPGDWPHAFVLAAESAVQAYRQRNVSALPYTPPVVEPLFEVLNMPAFMGVVDPFSDHPAVITGLRRAGVTVVAGTRAPPHSHNALSPAFQEAAQALVPVEAIVSAPWPPLLDMALPVMVAHASRVVCCLMPLSFICEAPPPRRSWLLALKRDVRMLFVHPPATAAGPAPAVWLLVFASATVASASVRAHGP